MIDANEPCPDLLYEARALTRERDEARADVKMHQELWRRCKEHRAWQAQEIERLREVLRDVMWWADAAPYAPQRQNVMRKAREALSDTEDDNE